MKVAVLELHYHEEFLNTIIDLFDDVDVYTTHKIYARLPETSKNKGVFYFCIKNKYRFLKTLQQLSSQYDVLFVNTIQPSMIDLPLYTNFKPKCKSVLTLHNLNAWNNNKFVYDKQFLRSVDSFIASRYSKKILNNFNIINVVYEPMICVAEKYFKKPIINIPYALSRSQVQPIENNILDLVIPGTVDEKRRDYNPVIHAYGKLCKKYDNISLVLLGKLKDYKYLNSCEHIKTFDEFVSLQTYNHYLEQSDVVICPSQKTTESVNMVVEMYGSTKSSNVHEAFIRQKPLLVPNYINTPKNFQSSTKKYSKNYESIYIILKEFLDNPDELNIIKNNAVINSNYYSKQKVYKQFKHSLFVDGENELL